MANTIKLKRGSGSNPGASDLSVGEVALRTDNGTLFTKNDAGNVTEIGASSGIADGDKGDITVSNSGATWSLDSGVVTTAIINNGAVNASKILDNVVSEAKLNVSNSPTNGYFLSAQSGNTGGLTWAAVDLSSKLSLTGGTLTGDLEIPHKLIHAGDSDTCMRFQTNIWSIEVGGNERIETNNTRTKFFHNIETTGTVDGRDLSVDGSKLDGIASGATNVTNTNQLTNGAGFITSADGGNAATLDGLDSVEFLRSNTADNMSAKLTLNQDNDNEKLVLAGTGDPYIRFQESTTNKAYIQWNSAGYLDIKNQEDSSRVRIKDAIDFSPDSSNFYTIWHAGNDGSGSGLDADTVDGQHLGTSSNPTFESVYLNDWLRNNTQSEGLYNVATDSHFYSAGNNYWHLNGDSGGITHGALILYDRYNVSHGNSTGRKGYLYWDSSGFGLLHSGGGWAVRTTSSATTLFGTLTHNGNTIWHAGNDGSGSGLDADTVDGIQAGAFVRADAEDSKDYALNINGGTGNGSNDASLYVTANNNNDWGLIVDKYRSSATEYGAQIKVASNASFALRILGSGSEKFRVSGSGAVYAGGTNTVWHQGNDGSGSGLDSDTVDGLHAVDFLRSNTGDTAYGDITFDGGAGAVTIHANSDIRLTNGNWTGDATKIQHHSNWLYMQGGTNGIIFRHTDGTNRWVIDSGGSFRPNANNTYDIGSSSNRVRNIYTNDLHLSNEGNSNSVDGTWGDWTLQEGDENIFMINNRSGKKYKMGLVEVN